MVLKFKDENDAQPNNVKIKEDICHFSKFKDARISVMYPKRDFSFV